MGTKCVLLFLVVFTAVVATGYCEKGPKVKRSLVSRFTSNPLFHKFFHNDDYQPSAYTSVTRGENYGDYQEPVYTDSWDGNYEYSYITPEEAYEEHDNNHDEIYEEKDDNVQLGSRFNEDNKDNKNAITVQKQNFFNTLPLYERYVAFRNRQKNKHEKANGNTEEKRSDIRFDEDEQDDNQPLFNSLPFYKTVKFSNNKLSQERTKLIEENEDKEEQNQILFNLLPYYEVAKMFRIPEDSNEIQSFLPNDDKSDSAIPQYHINWMVNEENNHHTVESVKHVTEASERPEKTVETRFQFSNNHEASTTNEGLKSDFFTSEPIEDDFITSAPVTFHRNPVFVSKINPALEQNIEDDKSYVFNSLPLYDNLGLYFNKLNNNEVPLNETNEIKSDNVYKNLIEESHNSLETMPATSLSTRKDQDEINGGTQIYIFKSLPYFERSLPFSSAYNTIENMKQQMETQVVSKTEAINKMPNEERKKLEAMPETSLSTEEKTRKEQNEINGGTQIYIFKSLPYFDRSLPFSSEYNKIENTKDQMEMLAVPKTEAKNKIPNEERKKVRGGRKKVKKVLVARRKHRNNFAAKNHDRSLQDPVDSQNMLAFGDRIKRKIEITDYEHAGQLPLADFTHPIYEVDSFGMKLNFTYDLNVENQLYNNLINKTMH